MSLRNNAGSSSAAAPTVPTPSTLTSKDPVRVLVTGAAGQLAYSLAPIIAKGHVFGPDQPVILHLLDVPKGMNALNGVVMELLDCAFPLLKDVVATDDEKTAFSGIDAAFLVASVPIKDSMVRRNLLVANTKMYKSQGRALDQYAKKSVKVLVVCNPANTIALVCSKYAPSIPKENFSALTRLDHNRAKMQIAQKLNVMVRDVRNVIIWGNHSSTQFPDASHASVTINGQRVKVTDAIKDEAYFRGEFLTMVQERGTEVYKARKLTSAMSAAKAAADHVRDWWHGTPEGEWVSMAVMSDGSYGSPADVVFSYPVQVDGQRRWRIVDGLSMSDFARDKLAVSGRDLVDERSEAMAVCKLD
ncbi:malate dehydrogenase, cytoplasmic-like [Dermacentor variabilis]|uniref:malate dehydrogenase, cytoplasmic-like n=1 Tax=Dermacentor variabilis TaxID=34621 RepID=UPI003F5CB306